MRATAKLSRNTKGWLKPEPRTDAFGLELARLRKLTGLSINEAARHIGIATCSLSHIEQGVRDPGLAALRKLYQAYGDDLLPTIKILLSKETS